LIPGANVSFVALREEKAREETQVAQEKQLWRNESHRNDGK
jgi:hypothetical protein